MCRGPVADGQGRAFQYLNNGWLLNVSRETEARQVRLPADTVRLFLYSKITPEFAVQNDKLSAQSGQVLFCLDVPLTEK